MSTGQKYSGKGEDATPPQQNGSDLEPTATPAPQEVNYDHLADTLSPEELAAFMHLSSDDRALVVALVESGERAEKVAATIYELAGKAQPHALPPGVFDFDELALFAGLSSAGKTIISTLAGSGAYQPGQLKRALIYISSAPDPTAGPDELINSKSLQSILAGEQPAFTIEGARGQTPEPMATEVPFFLQWQIKSADRTKSLLAAIERVFHEFGSSEAGKKIDEDINQMLAYSALRTAFVELIEKAANKLGTLDKPRISDFLFDLPQLAMGDPELDKTPTLVDNSFECINVDFLQEWVRSLQQMCLLQQKIGLNLEQQTSLLKEQVDNLQRQVQIYETAEKQAAARRQEKRLPSALPYVDLTLYLHGGIESEIELVQQALSDARNAKLKEMLTKLVVDETEEAFFIHEDFVKLQFILDRLATEVTETACNSYAQVEYKNRPSVYVNSSQADHERLMARKGAFIDDYSVFTNQEEIELATDTPAENNEQTPES